MLAISKVSLFAFFALISVAFSKSVDPLIVGGEQADIADFPHQLALINLRWNGHWCGASNIHRLWALSAAHCIPSNIPADLLNLQGGSTSRLSGQQTFFITRYTIHPDYDRRNLANDIVILEVDPATPLEGFTHVQSIPISPVCNSECCGACPDGENVVVTGWGDVDDGSSPVLLQMVDKAIMDINECRGYWGDVPYGMFCTVVENGRDSCNGDSGSPVIRNGIQIGLVSYGSEVCGDGSAPAVYVRLEDAIIRNWIATFVAV